MDKVLGYLKTVLGKSAEVIDAAVPVGHGNRTAFAVIASLVTQAVPVVVPLIPPPYGPAIVAALPLLQQALPIFVGLFAIAHMGRKPVA